MTYYNEYERTAAAWLRELIRDGLIPEGEVDERDIRDVTPADLRGYTQCHFFAGIGGWAYALRLAGIPDDIPVWTGSCPCQPLSCAGKQRGHEDERHLWPEFFRLIRECNPPTVFGEQVASNIGREWFAGVRSDLETVGYGVGAADLCASGIGAPHIRQRIYWMAVSDGHEDNPAEQGQCLPGEGLLSCDGLEVAIGNRWRGGRDGDASRLRREVQTEGRSISGVGQADTDNAGSQGRDADQLRERTRQRTPWQDSTLHLCRDTRGGRPVYRRIPTEPAFFPLAHGLPGRVGLLRGAGNAIVPQLAATFIEACCEAIEETMR